MWTYCTTAKPWTASTPTANISNWINYPKALWYINSSSILYTWGNTNYIFNATKSEINSNRPILINAYEISSWVWHSFVGYWYKSTTWNEKIVRINAWIWKIGVDNWSTYYYSSIDHNLDAMYMWTSGSFKASWYVTFNIK